MGVDSAHGIVSVKLNLTKDYRKAKSLVQNAIKNDLEWVTSVKVEMAP